MRGARLTTIAVLVAIYVGLVCVVLAILIAAGRADDSADRQTAELLAALGAGARPTPAGDRTARIEALPDHPALAGVVAEVRDLLDVEQMTVIVGEEAGDRAEDGVVGACLGAPGLLGTRVPLAHHADIGVVSSKAVPRGRFRAQRTLAYAHFPLDGTEGISGAIVIAARRSREFTRGELKAVERLARHGAPEFERRRHPRTA